MPSPSSLRRRARPLLGTLVEVSAEGEGAALDAAIDAAFAEIAEVHRRMSAHEPGSDLAGLRGEPPGRVVTVSAHTVVVVRAALAWARASDGAFNPCLGRTMARLGHLPPDECSESDDFSALEVIDETHLRRRARVSLDLGGIAKGYAVDLAVERLQQATGVAAGLVNAGGDLRCFGRSQDIGIRDPAAPQRLIETVALHNAAMATSAPYFSPPELGSALYDVTRQCTRTGAFSVSVTAAHCMTADALTKVVLNAPPARAAELLSAQGAIARWHGVPDAA